MIGNGKFASELPRFQGSSEQKWQQVEQYLYRLQEQLRFAFSNIKSENLNPEFKAVIEKKAEYDETEDESKVLSADAVILDLSEVGKTGAFIIRYKGENAAVIALDDTENTLWIATNSTPGKTFSLNLISGGKMSISTAAGLELPNGDEVMIGGVSLEEYIKSMI